jgi:hypothetical protein
MFIPECSLSVSVFVANFLTNICLNRNQRLAEGERLAADEPIAVILSGEGGNTGFLSAKSADSTRGGPIRRIP